MITTEQMEREVGAAVTQWLVKFGPVDGLHIERLLENKRAQIMRREDRRDRIQAAWDARPWSRRRGIPRNIQLAA